ncbi:MAG: hypothetical protein AB7N99_08670 [Simkaniaceae bacterium]
MSSSVQNNSELFLPGQSPSISSFQKDVTAMMLVLNETMQSYLENQSYQQDVNAKVSDLNLKNMVSNLLQNDHDLYKASHESFWQKLFKGICDVVAVLVIGVGIATGNFEFAALAGGLLVMDKLNGFQELAKGVGDVVSGVLQGFGVPKEDADKIGDAIGDVLVVAAAITVGVMMGSGAEVAEGVEELTEGAEELTKGAEEVTEGAKGSTSTTEGSFNKKTFGFGAITGASATTAVSENFFINMLNLFDPNGKKNDEIAAILTLVTDVLAAITGIAGGVSLYKASDMTTTLSRGMSKMGSMLAEGMSNLAPNMVNFFSENAETIKQLGRGMLLTTEFVGGASKMAEGGADAALANTQYQMALSTEAAELSINLNNQIMDAMKNIQKYLDNGIITLGDMTSSTDVTGVLDAFAETAVANA